VYTDLTAEKEFLMPETDRRWRPVGQDLPPHRRNDPYSRPCAGCAAHPEEEEEGAIAAGEK